MKSCACIEPTPVRVKGRILRTTVYWFVFSIDSYEIESRNVYYSKQTAKRYAERLAKQLGLVIEWEGER